MLRRIAGAPIKGENYSRAKIEGGRVSAEQTAPSASLIDLEPVPLGNTHC